jgi:tetratricopeptide (TPR) repeat protein
MNTARRRVLASLLGLALAGPAWAAFASSPVPPGRIAAPRIFVPNAGEPIRLDAVRIETEITGGFAYTQVEMTFFNPNRRVFEGELQFPLLDGQNVIGFSLDVNGKMREASSVPKARGQEAFEEIARRGVDPGLLQVTQGNNFKLRVYPLFAQGRRIVQVRYVESLTGRGAHHVFRLPVEYGSDIRSFSVNVVARGADRSPAVIAGLPAGQAFQREGDDYVLAFERSGYTPGGMMEVAVAAGERPAVFVQPFDGQRYFVAEVRDRSRAWRRVPPGEIGLIWDASLSARERDRRRELALLDAYFRRVHDARVWLTRLRDAAEPGEWHEVRGGNWDGLRAALEATIHDGATNLGDFEPGPAVGEYLLFSDGISNFGGKPFPHTQVPVYAISASRQSDPAALRHIAERSGGRYIDLVADSRSVAAAKLLSSASRIESVAADGASQVILASRYAEHGRFVIAGVLDEPAASVRLRIDNGGEPREVTFEVGRKSSASSVAARRWAYLRAGELEREFTVNRGELERIGMRFGIVTRETSLIVLELARDYAQYDIAPPPELKAEVERLRPHFARQRVQDEAQLLDRAAQLYAQRGQWWEREFPKGRKPAPVEDRRSPAVRPDVRERRLELFRGMGAGASRSLDMASPRPAPQQATPAKKSMAQAMEVAPAPSSSPAEERIALGELAGLRSWQADAPYLSRMRLADTGDLYRIYLDMRHENETSAGYYLDVARLLAERGLADLAVRVLSNLAEIDLENRHLLRVLGHRLMAAGKPDLALGVFARVLELAPYEPQSHRDLALAYGAMGQSQKAADHLYEIARRTWHVRFPGIQELAAAELSALVARPGNGIDTSRMDARLLRNLPVQLRVVASWDSDNTNIDLLVTDPNGEVAQPGRVTYQGGRQGHNFLGGYGPEEFALRQAKAGRYQVAVRHSGTRQQTVIAPTTVQIAITTGFGTPAEKTEVITRRISPHQTVTVAELDITGQEAPLARLPGAVSRQPSAASAPALRAVSGHGQPVLR